MKRVTTLLVLLGGLTLAVADVTVTDTAVPTETTIATETQVQTQERVQQMNEMKERLAQMSPQERETAMEEMHGTMPEDMQSQMQDGSAMSDEQKTQMQEHMGELQMQNSEQMTQHENMNQHQAGKQFSDELQSSHTMGTLDGGGMQFGGRGKNTH
jgi:preprotein translocase subunit SecF